MFNRVIVYLFPFDCAQGEKSCNCKFVQSFNNYIKD